ncbi:MAG: BamA/TamA family outer membrane protein, partial [Gemmatimonadota bacterium]|nr:BamA/TamA family outer membrane protein [Gemmatimonadota bacterium]
KDSDLFLGYQNLKHQTNYYLSALHTRNFFISNGQVVADRILGGGAVFQRPFNRFTRLETSMQAISISRENLGSYQSQYLRGGYTGRVIRGSGTPVSSNKAVINSLELVDDNALYSLYGPTKGRRARLSVRGSWAGMRYGTVQADYRKYIPMLDEYTFAVRMSGGTSFGRNSQVFFLGGVNNSINPNFATFASVDRQRIFFSSFVWPLRGADVFEMAGDSYVLANVAFRFPLLRQLALGWPLPLFFQNVQGELFLDAGSAFNRDSFEPWEARDGGFELRDLKAGYGLGVRVNMGLALFRYDLAWPTDFAETGHPKQYFSIDFTGLF